MILHINVRDLHVTVIKTWVSLRGRYQIFKHFKNYSLVTKG